MSGTVMPSNVGPRGCERANIVDSIGMNNIDPSLPSWHNVIITNSSPLVSLLIGSYSVVIRHDGHQTQEETWHGLRLRR